MLREHLARGRNADKRADVYGLGRLLYYLLLGRRPYIQREPHATLSDLADETDPRLLAIIRKATQLEREQRYESVDDLALGIAMAPPSTPPVHPIAGGASAERGDGSPSPGQRQPRPQPPADLVHRRQRAAPCPTRLHGSSPCRPYRATHSKLRHVSSTVSSFPSVHGVPSGVPSGFSSCGASQPVRQYATLTST